MTWRVKTKLRKLRKRASGFDEETVSHSAPFIFPHVPLYFSVMHLQEVDEAVLVKESDVVVTCLKVARIFYFAKVHHVKLRSNLLLVYLILVPDQCL